MFALVSASRCQHNFSTEDGDWMTASSEQAPLITASTSPSQAPLLRRHNAVKRRLRPRRSLSDLSTSNQVSTSLPQENVEIRFPGNQLVSPTTMDVPGNAGNLWEPIQASSSSHFVKIDSVSSNLLTPKLARDQTDSGLVDRISDQSTSIHDIPISEIGHLQKVDTDTCSGSTIVTTGVAAVSPFESACTDASGSVVSHNGKTAGNSPAVDRTIYSSASDNDASSRRTTTDDESPLAPPQKYANPGKLLTFCDSLHYLIIIFGICQELVDLDGCTGVAVMYSSEL